MTVAGEAAQGQEEVPLALQPIRPSTARPVAGPTRPRFRKYITDVHTRSSTSPAPSPARAPATVTILAVERSNAGAKVSDLRKASAKQDGVEVEVEVLPPPPPEPGPRRATEIPDLPEEIRPEVEEVPPPLVDVMPPYEEEISPDVVPSQWEVPSQVDDTHLPHLSDGLAGNRQVALTPFPNLNIDSGPLDSHQLPWQHRVPEERPFSFAQTVEFQTAAGFLESNGADDFDYGWYNSLVWAMPFWREKGVGVQFGVTVEPTTFPQILTEVNFGAFRRAIWADDPDLRLRLFERASWGIGFDGVYDSENRVFVGQHRGQFAYALAPNREIGTWFAIPLGSEVTTIPNDGVQLEIGTTAHVATYYRHVWPSELDGTIFVGTTESPGGFMIGSYLSYRFSAQASWILQGMKNFGSDGGQSLYLGLRLYCYPLTDYSLISGNPQNRYRVFMPAPDHINLQLRKTNP